MQWTCKEVDVSGNYHPMSALAERGEAGISVRMDDTAIFVENPRGSEDNADNGEVEYDAMVEYETTVVGRGKWAMVRIGVAVGLYE